MTVSELIAHLQTLPQDLIVQCLAEESRAYETWTKWKNLTPDDIYYVGSYLEIGSK